MEQSAYICVDCSMKSMLCQICAYFCGLRHGNHIVVNCSMKNIGFVPKIYFPTSSLSPGLQDANRGHVTFRNFEPKHDFHGAIHKKLKHDFHGATHKNIKHDFRGAIHKKKNMLFMEQSAYMFVDCSIKKMLCYFCVYFCEYVFVYCSINIMRCCIFVDFCEYLNLYIRLNYEHFRSFAAQSKLFPLF